MGNQQHPTPITRHPSLAVTLCELCMPEAFCGLEMCAKRLSELCALCERKNLPSVRGKTPQRLAGILSYREGTFSFSQIYTEEKNTQNPTETLSQPITQNVTANRGLTPSPSPNGEGSDYRDTPVCPLYA